MRYIDIRFVSRVIDYSKVSKDITKSYPANACTSNDLKEKFESSVSQKSGPSLSRTVSSSSSSSQSLSLSGG